MKVRSLSCPRKYYLVFCLEW